MSAVEHSPFSDAPGNAIRAIRKAQQSLDFRKSTCGGNFSAYAIHATPENGIRLESLDHSGIWVTVTSSPWNNDDADAIRFSKRLGSSIEYGTSGTAVIYPPRFAVLATATFATPTTPTTPSPFVTRSYPATNSPLDGSSDRRRDSCVRRHWRRRGGHFERRSSRRDYRHWGRSGRSWRGDHTRLDHRTGCAGRRLRFVPAYHFAGRSVCFCPVDRQNTRSMSSSAEISSWLPSALVRPRDPRGIFSSIRASRMYG